MSFSMTVAMGTNSPASSAARCRHKIAIFPHDFHAREGALDGLVKRRQTMSANRRRFHPQIAQASNYFLLELLYRRGDATKALYEGR